MKSVFSPLGRRAVAVCLGLASALIAGLGVAVDAAPGQDRSKPRTIQFNRDIRPILSDRCFKCHGHDKNQRQADLRLDEAAAAIAKRDGGAAIVPGKPQESLLVQRILSTDPDERMPPADSGKSLSAAEKQLLRRWVAQGAEYEPHWSYIPPRRPQVPAATAELRNPIDRLLSQRLTQLGLQMSPAADRRTLIRRLTFDLTGMPPTAEEVEAFVRDKSPRAYEALVDRLLKSPRYGERMAIYWLDIVRYADTNGIHGDNHREHWLYREYVIKAFNQNKPFDVFTREQLAGDLLPNATIEQRIASGYNRLNMTTREGGAQAKEYRAKYAADRVRNASVTWLGSTMGCCECHDHKFDPFTTEDFYSFAAFFADLQETAVGVQKPFKLPTVKQAAELRKLDARIAVLEKKLQTTTPELAAAQKKWEQVAAKSEVRWSVVRPKELKSEGKAKLQLEKDGSVRASGPNPDKDVYTLVFDVAEPITGLRLEVLPEASAPAKGPGRAGNGNFVVSEVQLFSGDERVAIETATATHSQKSWNIAAAIDGKDKTGWAILPQLGRSNEAVFQLKADLQGACRLVLRQQHGGRHTLARFRVSTTGQPRPLRAKGGGLPANIAKILQIPAAKRQPSQAEALARYFRSIAPQLAPLRKQIAAHRQQQKKIRDQAPSLLVAQTMAKPRTMRVLPRGNWLDDSGTVVSPATPGFLPGSKKRKEGRGNRLDLARWIVDPQNPLTARVFVNRLWKLAFGRGIVKSLDDFGSQGANPSHPELLDWLAIEFRENGWNVKRLLKQIVMSRAYQQASRATRAQRERDPYNQYFARQGAYRLDAEMIRDSALAVSGLLVEKLGGPSVKPYQPAGYWSHLNFPKRVYKHDVGENQYRRGLYTYWCRTFLHPGMLAFDAPTREECTVERPRSNTPLAALVLLNDPSYVEAARVFAERILRNAPDKSPAGRIQFAYRLALQRQASDPEVAILSRLLAEHRKQYEEDPAAAAAVLKNGLRDAPKDLSVAELASLTSIARVIFNLHEFIARN